jgi:hypothetical protein
MLNMACHLHDPLIDQIPQLYSDLDTNPFGTQPADANIWMGTGGIRTPLYFKGYDSLLVQIVGATYIRWYSPSKASKLYVRGTNGSRGLQGAMSEVDCELEDYEQHPLAKDCAYSE